LADSRGLIWLATQEGLNIFDPESNSIYRYYIDDGLPDNSPLAILEDNDGLIWISTISGITNIRIGDRVESGRYKLEFASFNESDGLQGKEFNEGIAYKTTRGELIFGGPNGFNIFNPSDLTYNTKPPDILITGLQIFNRTIRTGQKVNGRIILSNAITETSEIVLKHFEDVVSIEFAALNYIHPEKNRYEYILEGFNREWMQAGANERKATYTNLDPGEYVFRVKGSNNDGIWNTNGKSLKIIVKPSIWKTKAAIISYFILLLTALILLRYMILLKERIRVQIDQERQEARRRHELDLLKIRFFTNVSHEFRTPLSLILAPLEKLLKKGGNGNEEERSQYKLMYRNSRRLLNLVNQLLDFRRMEVQKISLRPAYGDIVIFINEIFQTFTDLAERKRITFTYTTSHNEFFTWFDHDKVEKIIFNLLSNAFKFTPEGEKIGIDLHIEPAKKNLGQHEDPKSEQDRVKVKVCDTGIGIPAENINRIFDRFFQNDVPDSMINQGSGIGLSLTKEFVQLHNGTIEVESEPGKGSCFTVTLLLSAVALGTTQGQDDLSESITLLPEEEEIDIKPVTNGKKALVLLIEDNDDFRFYLKDNLKGRYSIIEACDGKEGIAKAIGNLPDLIVSDIMMPEVDGIELCRQVKSNPNTSHIPIILLTARMSEQKKLKGFETGADDYITKPFSFEMLESRMNNLIEQRERIRNSFQQHFKIEPGEIGITSLDEKLIEKALKLVENNMSNSDFSVEKLSRELGMSRVHLYKKLTSLTGKTPIEFIRTMRLKRAAQLLGKSQLTVSEIAYEVGFNDPRYFSKYFKTEFGVLPSQYGNSKKTSQN
jgi:signal transduction histidine kinase/DNA-binding response OmpR family regulator